MINLGEGTGSNPETERVSFLRQLADRNQWSHSAARALLLIAEEVGIEIPSSIKVKALDGDPVKDAEVREFIALEAEKLLAKK